MEKARAVDPSDPEIEDLRRAMEDVKTPRRTP
jgi:hypothetical protein